MKPSVFFCVPLFTYSVLEFLLFPMQNLFISCIANSKQLP